MVKKVFHNLDKAFENNVRLGIMSALCVNDYLDFNTLKELLEVTDGNLASHLKSLENRQYIRYKKEIVLRKMHTTYSATTEGREAFQRHIQAMEEILKQHKK